MSRKILGLKKILGQKKILGPNKNFGCLHFWVNSNFRGFKLAQNISVKHILVKYTYLQYLRPVVLQIRTIPGGVGWGGP